MRTHDDEEIHRMGGVEEGLRLEGRLNEKAKFEDAAWVGRLLDLLYSVV